MRAQILETSFGIATTRTTQESSEGKGLKTRNQEQRRLERSFLFVRHAGKSTAGSAIERQELVTTMARLVI